MRGIPATWSENTCLVFCHALSGILANPEFFGPIYQGDPKAAVEFAIRITRAARGEDPDGDA